jgi:hypothetical protein
MRAIAGLNHPVFRDKPVNQDPREAFIHELFRGRGEYNAFHEYYHALARALFEAGVTRNVFCVNIDGVIGALLLKMLWPRYLSGSFSEHDLEVSAFTIFLYGRMIGCAARSTTTSTAAATWIRARPLRSAATWPERRLARRHRDRGRRRRPCRRRCSVARRPLGPDRRGARQDRRALRHARLPGAAGP